jgi:hypothetical protein
MLLYFFNPPTPKRSLGRDLAVTLQTKLRLVDRLGIFLPEGEQRGQYQHVYQRDREQQ